MSSAVQEQAFPQGQHIPHWFLSKFKPHGEFTGIDRPKAILILLYLKSPKGDMSYLEKIRSLGREANPFFCMTGIDIMTSEPGAAVLLMPVRPDMHNGVGWLQGGMLVALADEAMALALYPLLEKNEGIATIAESPSFIRGVQTGTIIAEARVIRKGRRVAFMEADVWADDGKKTLLSRTSASFAITAAT
jgi:uncharacterized protein (TIGR00369 family)